MARLAALRIAAASLFALGLPAGAVAADWYVSGTGSNANPGSVTRPFRTISHAMGVASGGDTIKVLAGTYDVAGGESFPISIKHDVDIIGQGSYPSVGGDVNSSSVHMLFYVDGTAGDRTGIDVAGLHFVGENSSGKDAPAALLVRSQLEHDVDARLADCVIDRSEMNDSGSNDKPAIWMDAGWGTCTLALEDCDIEPAELGGIAVLCGPDTTNLRYAHAYVTVTDCEIALTGTDDAVFGIGCYVSGNKYFQLHPDIQRNLIDSSGADSGHGIGTGYAVSFVAGEASSLSATHSDSVFVWNEVLGCTSDGMLLRNDPQADTSGSHISIWVFDHNEFRDNAGAGLRVDQGSTDSEPGGPYGGYITVLSVNNLYAGNGSGVHFSGENAGGQTNLQNDTVVDNAGYAFVTDDGIGPVSVENSIVYFNHGGGDQYDTAGDWDPGASLVDYNDWEDLGLGVGTGNIDLDPDFINHGGGDYHLDDESPCIDVGNNSPTGITLLADEDIDHDDRVLDGDGGGAVVDMGYDEFAP